MSVILINRWTQMPVFINHYSKLSKDYAVFARIIDTEDAQISFEIYLEDKLDAIDSYGRPAMTLASMRNHIVAIKKLSEKGDQIQSSLIIQEHQFGNTALMWSIANSSIDAALMLLDENVVTMDIIRAQIEIACSTGNTPLILACLKGAEHIDDSGRCNRKQREVIDRLLDLNANVNAQNKDGNTALHFAILHRDVALIKKLIQHGAKLDIKNKEGQTPEFFIEHQDKDLAIKTVGVCSFNSLTKEEFISLLIKDNSEELNPIIRPEIQKRLRNCLKPLKERIETLERKQDDLKTAQIKSRLQTLLSDLENKVNNYENISDAQKSILDLLESAKADPIIKSELPLLITVCIAILNVFMAITGLCIVNRALFSQHFFFHHQTETERRLDETSLNIQESLAL